MVEFYGSFGKLLFLNDRTLDWQPFSAIPQMTTRCQQRVVLSPAFELVESCY